jgi:MarR family transcriptional regulator, 2-MHQ and catechol-resistance regulon repressor
MWEDELDKPTKRALAAYTNLVCATDSFVSLLTRQTEAFGLTLGQFRALEALLHQGPMSQVILGEKIFSTESNMRVVAVNLEKRGLVHRERNKTGKPGVTVQLTEEGRKLIEKVFPLHATVIRAQMSALTAREQEVLRHLCRKLGEGDAVEFIKVMMKVGSSDLLEI